MNQSPPAGFPTDIQLYQSKFVNWAGDIVVPDLWTCAPTSAAQVAEVCNWAKDNNFQVRPRGIMHTWSPITVTPGESPANVVLLDTTKYLKTMEFIPAAGNLSARVKVGTGATMTELLTFLEQQAGGGGDAAGYSFPHTPAPGNITVGGVLAIDAHGTAIPSPADDFNAPYGSLSNLIVEFTAIVFDEASSSYKPVTFQRGQGDDKAFLTHLGRAFLTDATLQVIENYNLRCQSYTNLSWQTIFQQPSASTPIPPDSFADFLTKTGRVEAIWYPFSDNPWLKVWTHTAVKPAESKAVTGINNYPFSDNLPDWVTDLFKLILGVPLSKSLVQLVPEVAGELSKLGAQLQGRNDATARQLADSLPEILSCLVKQLGKIITGSAGGAALTPCLGELMAFITAIGLFMDNATDIWGPSKNTLLYIGDQTLRVTANGYAIHLRRQDVQQGIADFAAKFNELLLKYEAANQFPVNAPLEIRVTALDDPSKVSVGPGVTAMGPVISALGMSSTDIENKWDTALWLDVLTLPLTPYSNEFYVELEAWMEQRFSGTAGAVMPEWSKGWAYTTEGAWKNQDFINRLRRRLTTGRSDDDNWNWEVATLKKYDPHNLFSNPFLDEFMIPL